MEPDLWGDVNRSHSSQVLTSSGGTTTVQTNAVNSLATNTAFRTMAVQSNSTGTNINTNTKLNINQLTILVFPFIFSCFNSSCIFENFFFFVSFLRWSCE